MPSIERCKFNKMNTFNWKWRTAYEKLENEERKTKKIGNENR